MIRGHSATIDGDHGSSNRGTTATMTTGISTRPAEMRLTERAADFLAAGPADVVALIGHICQLPNPPRVVAEHMATALFAGRTEFLRNESGQWSLTPRGRPPVDGAGSTTMPSGRVSELRGVDYAASRNAGDLLSSLSYVVVDVETTGTRAWNGDRVTEIAAV